MSDEKCGLNISLMKYVFSEQNHNNTGNFILGYFDAMKIQAVNNWLDFSPGKTSTDYDSNIVSRYQIKLLFPQEKVRSVLERYGCYSRSWESVDQQDFNMFDEYPCVSVILVNLTDQFKQLNIDPSMHWDAYGDVLKRFGKLIDGLHIADKLVNANVCILPSVGYSDYCILLAEKRWDTAFELIRKLHRIKWKSGKKDDKTTLHICTDADATPLLSTDYMMPVFHVKRDINIDSISSCDLTAHVNLAPGISMEALSNKLGKGITVKQVSGTSDCILEAKPGYQKHLLELLISTDPSDKRENLFVSTRATLQKKFSRRTPPGSIDYTPSFDEIEDSISRMWDILDKYATIVKQAKHHMRQVQAAKEIIATIKNICKERHNISFRRVIKPFIEDFTEDLRTLVSAIEDPRNCKAAKLRYFIQVEEALEIFRNRFGSFIADITRSDCFFMETEQYNHASISSATSLILGYNRLINGFSEKVCKLDDPNADLRYSFIVTSGGCDRTDVINIFSELDPEEEDGRITENRLPFLVQMSEMGLFDCGGTVLRLFHECSHYCGDRARKQRLHYMVEFLARSYGRILSEALLDKQGIVGHLRQEFDSILPATVWTDDQKKTLDHVHAQCTQELTAQLTEILAQAIRDGLHDEVEEETACGMAKKGLPNNYDHLGKDAQLAAIASCLGEVDCIGRKLQRRLRKILVEIFYVYEVNEVGHHSANQFARNVYEATLAAERNFYAGCYDKLQTGSASMITFAYEKRLRDAQIQKDKAYSNSDEVKSAANKKLEQRVNFTLQRLIADKSISVELDEKVLNKLPSITLAEQNVNAILDMTIEVFSETFADMAACTLLKASLEDYLLAFVFESWMLDESLIPSTDMKLRIGVMLQLCFSDQLNGNGLSDSAKEDILSGVQTLKQCGMQEDRINANALVARIEEILNGYKQMEHEAKPLLMYLQECKQKYDIWSKTSEMQHYQGAFDQMRLYRFSGEDIHEKVIAMVQAVTTGG